MMAQIAPQPYGANVRQRGITPCTLKFLLTYTSAAFLTYRKLPSQNQYPAPTAFYTDNHCFLNIFYNFKTVKRKTINRPQMKQLSYPETTTKAGICDLCIKLKRGTIHPVWVCIVHV